jgi:hypothetical protein
MSPTTAAQLLQAMRNHHRPPRTLAARVRDAIQHAKQSQTQGQNVVRKR